LKPKSILLLGSIALDTIKTKYGEEADLIGGSATYAALSSSLFTKVNLVGIIGDDFPDKGKEILKNSCNSIKDLIIEKGKTFRWGGEYHENGDDRKTLFTDLGVFENFSPQLSSENSNPDFVFLANIHPDLQLSVLNQCKSNPFVITDTMNLWIDTAGDSLEKVLRLTDLLLINQSEVYDLTKIKNVELSIKKIFEMGPKKVLVKYGSKGSTIYDIDGTVFSVGVVDIPKVIDPTGAGDSYGGGLLSGLAEGLTIKDSMFRGTVMASFCIEDFGIKSIYNLNIDKVNERITTLRKAEEYV